MSDLPRVDIEIEDGGLGVGLASTAKSVAVIGCSSAGTPLVPTGFVNKNKLVAAMGYGPAVEAAALDIDAGATVIFTKVASSTPGAAGAVTHTGTGDAVLTVTGAPFDRYDVQAIPTRDGTVATAPYPAFKYSLDGGKTFSGEIRIPSTGAYVVPNTGMTFTYGEYQKTVTGDSTSEKLTHVAHGFVNGDKIHFTNSGGALPAPLVAGTTYFVVSATADDFQVALTAGGSPVNLTTNGTGTTTAAKFATIVTSDTYVFTTTPPAWTANDVGLALDALSASPKEWRFIHLVGTSNKTEAVAVDAKMSSMETAHRYVSALVEARDIDVANAEPLATWQAAIEADFLTMSSDRIVVGGGYASIASALNVAGRGFMRAPGAWAAAQRACAVEIHVDLGRVKDGALKVVDALYYNEETDGGLDADRFLTLRTFNGGEPGYFVTNPMVMSPPGSDFKYWQYRFVMDAICRTSYKKLLQEVNDSTRTDPATGFILETDAQAIEAANDEALRNDIIAPGHASLAKTTVSRDDDILGTSTVNVEVDAIPLGYKKKIKAKIGFVKTISG